MVTVADIEEEVARRITSLDPSDFRALPLDAFRESRIPLTAVEDSAGISHLAFSVSIENCPVIDDQQGHDYGAVDVMADMVVIFVFKLAATTKMLDYRLSSEAARRILSKIMEPYELANFFPVQVFKPGIIRDGWMPVELRFRVSFELPI